MSNKQKKQASVEHVPKFLENKESRGRMNSSSGKNKYQIGALLGRGGFAQCYKGTNVESRKQYAIKMIDKKSASMKKSGAMQRLTNQIVLMSRLKHENITKLVQSFDDQHNYYLVLELCNKISLTQMLKKRQKVSEAEAKYYIRQLMMAILYLKQMHVIHRDIKTPNIFLDENLILKLGDFGLAVSLDTNDPQRYCVCGTPCFMAPEITRRQKYSFEVDMWSAGVVTFILLFGITPFVVHKQKKLSDQQKIYYKYQFPQNRVSEKAKNFIQRIFVVDPKLRLTPQQALCHQFLTQYVPTALPIQCYDKQVSTRRIQQYIRSEKIPDVKPPKTRQHQVSRHTRTITSYFNRTVPDKALAKAAKKELKDTKDKQSQMKMQQQIQMEAKEKLLKVDEVQPFSIKVTPNISESKVFSQQKCHNVEQVAIIMKQVQFVEEKQLHNSQKHLNKIGAAPPSFPVQSKPTPQYFEQSIESTYQQAKNQDNTAVDQWVEQKLGSEPYIYEFKDDSDKFGICCHLSNGVKVALYNDKTMMAISQINRKVVYIEPIDKQFEYCQRLLYKLTKISTKTDQANNNNQQPQYALQRDQPKRHDLVSKPYYKNTEFKTHQLPNDIGIAKKYFLLRDYCRKCTKRNTDFLRKYCSADLQKCAMMIVKWGCKRKSDQYIFVTANYLQIMFGEGTSYFINKKKPQLCIANEYENLKKVIDLPLKSKKALTKRQRAQFQIVQKFLMHAIGRQKQGQTKSNGG